MKSNLLMDGYHWFYEVPKKDGQLLTNWIPFSYKDSSKLESFYLQHQYVSHYRTCFIEILKLIF